MHHRITMIAAIGKGDRGLGKAGRLLYEFPEDKQHFHDATKGHPVIMGRKTWESLPSHVRPMRGRTNIVITRNASYEALGATVVTNIEDALAQAKKAPGAEEICIIGGGEIYTAALPYADRLDLTIVDADAPADALFPEYEKEFTEVVSERPGAGHEGISYTFLVLDRDPAQPALH